MKRGLFPRSSAHFFSFASFAFPSLATCSNIVFTRCFALLGRVDKIYFQPKPTERFFRLRNSWPRTRQWLSPIGIHFPFRPIDCFVMPLALNVVSPKDTPSLFSPRCNSVRSASTLSSAPSPFGFPGFYLPEQFVLLINVILVSEFLLRGPDTHHRNCFLSISRRNVAFIFKLFPLSRCRKVLFSAARSIGEILAILTRKSWPADWRASLKSILNHPTWKISIIDCDDDVAQSIEAAEGTAEVIN